MNVNLVPPLSFTSAIKVAESLYYHQNLNDFDGLSSTFLVACENVESLPVPQHAKDKILSVVQPVGEEISQWLWEFREILPSDINLYNLFCWNTLGSIDYIRTAEKCIWSGEMKNISAYKLACTSGNFETIRQLWSQVKYTVLHEIELTGYSLGMHPKPLNLWPTLWTAYLSGHMPEFRVANSMEELMQVDESDIVYICRRAVRCNNVGTASFFIRKLPSIEKSTVLMRLIRGRIFVHVSDFHPRMFLCLYNHLDEDIRRDLLFNYKADVLLRILKWPSAHLFIPMAEYLWSAFPFNSLHKIVERICVKIMQMQYPAFYENIFVMLWSNLPSVKQRAFFKAHLCNTLCNLFRPYKVEIAITALFKGNPDAYENFVKTFIGKANAVCNVLVEENKFKAFRNLLLRNFSLTDLADDFESILVQYTVSYVEEYYGILTSESSSESDIEELMEADN